MDRHKPSGLSGVCSCTTWRGRSSRRERCTRNRYIDACEGNGRPRTLLFKLWLNASMHGIYAQHDIVQALITCWARLPAPGDNESAHG